MNADAKNAEPSMEEILASIRRIIADGSEAAPNADNNGEGGADAADNDDTVIELTQELKDDGSVMDLNAPADDMPHENISANAKPNFAAMMAEMDEPAPAATDSLLSDMAAQSAASALAQLANTIEKQTMAMPQHFPIGDGSRTLEGLVVDILRPMLKDWLDQNLPPMIERLVAKEIQKITRGL